MERTRLTIRYRVGGGCLKNSGFNTGIWTQDTYQLSIYIIPYDQRPSIKRDRAIAATDIPSAVLKTNNSTHL